MLKTTTTIYCDRCEREARTLDEDETLPPSRPPALRISVLGETLYNADDLCPKCERAVRGLLDRITLAKDADGEPGPDEATE